MSKGCSKTNSVFAKKLVSVRAAVDDNTNLRADALLRQEWGIEPDKLIRMLCVSNRAAHKSDFMPVTIGSLFRRIVRVLQAQEDNPNSYLNNPNSDFYNPNYDINNPCSIINNQNSGINNASNNQYNKELRRNALRELVQMYLSDYLSSEQAEALVKEYIP